MSVTQIVTRQIKDAAVTLAKLLLLTKGDIVTSNGATNSALAVGSNGQVLQANSGAAAGLAWADAPGMDKNRIINGAMRFAQRGTSLTGGAATAVYTLDRWLWFNTSAAITTITRDTDVPSALNVPYSLKVAVTTADNSVAAGDVAYLSQIVEGYQFLPLKGLAFTVSFWAKSNIVGTYSVSFLNTGKDRSYVGTYAIGVPNTWVKYTVTLTHDTTGTWDYVDGAGCRLNFALMAGTTFQGTAGAWASSGAIATSAQPNVMSTVANNFFLTGVQMELGSVPTAFEQRPNQTELLLCARYFHKSFDVDTTPGTATTVGEQRYIAAGTGGEASAFVTFPTAMRISPGVTFYSPITGASGNRRHYNASADEVVTGFNTLGQRGASGSNTGHTTGDIYGFQLTLNAELT